jgi:gluconolactonase
MRSTGLLTIALSVFAAGAGWCQIPPPAGQTQGPGVQAPRDSRYADAIKACKTPPAPPRPPAAGATAPAPTPRAYSVTEIPGVIDAGKQWKEVWQVDGNNADGIVGTEDGGLLLAQNDNSAVVKLELSGQASLAYTGMNTGGSLAFNAKGALFLLNRGLYQSIEQLAPERKTLTGKTVYGDSLDCLGGVLNDLTADSRGGVYFTMGGLYYADAKGAVTRYGENLTTNGIVLSADETHLWVTNGPALAVFDVQKDGALTNQREFARLEGCTGFQGPCTGDGSTFDAAGRLYVTSQAGVQVIGPDGKYLGLIPTDRNVISVAFSGPDRKTLYAVSRENALNKDWIIAIEMAAQGARGRGK